MPLVQHGLSAMLVVLTADLALVVVSGGWSVSGRVSPTGFALRAILLFALVVWRFRSSGEEDWPVRSGYVALLLVLVALLHFNGFRLRGDGLWLYPYARSLAFDGDLDLTNEYQRLGIDQYRGSQIVPETGLARNTFPVGVGLLWVPFVRFGTLGVWMREMNGVDTPADGYTDPYLHSVALGSLLLGWAGLLVLHGILRRWFDPGVAFAAVSGVALGSFFLFYLSYHSIYTHTPTFLFMCLLLDRWLLSRGDRLRDFALMGLLVGLAYLVRWQSAVWMLLPAWQWLTALGKQRARFLIFAALATGSAFLLGVIPQLVAWHTIFGQWWIGVPLGADYMLWGEPFFTETLFASRHGLFSWSPLLLFATLGFTAFVWRRPRVGLPLAVLALVLFYVNSAVADWWGGGSFGARRFDSTLPMFALGLASFLAAARDFVARRPMVAVGAALAVFFLWNFLLVEQYRRGRIPADDTMSWERTATLMMEDAFDAVGYPFSFPQNWLFARRYDRPKTQYDLLVGKYLFHRQNNLEGVIDIGRNDPPFIGNGWTGVRPWKDGANDVRLAVGERAGVLVPLARPLTLRVLVEAALPEGAAPEPVDVFLNGERLGTFVPGEALEEHAFAADAALFERINLLELAPRRPTSAPYLAVNRVRFEPTKY